MVLETFFPVPNWLLLITLVNVIVYKLRQLQEANHHEQNIPSPPPPPSDPLCRLFSLAEIHSATNYFDEALVIGKGSFGKVYRGFTHGTGTVAIKRLDRGRSKQGATEFWTEIEMLSKFRHSHLVSLKGYCSEANEMILVYEYMPLGSLSNYLHKGGGPLTWVQRLKICIGAARGLDYLHTGTGIQHRVIHRDVKTSNILLDDNLEARISDFGLSKIGPVNQLQSHVSTYLKGTFGYVDPDYFLTWRLTRKSDIYSFGVVLFEIICGRMAVDLSLEENQRGLAGWAQNCVKKGILDQIVDHRLRGQILSTCLTEFGKIAVQCLHINPRKRPTMSEVVARLEHALALQEDMDFSVVDREIVGIAWDEFEKEETADYCLDEIKASENLVKHTEKIDSVATQNDSISGLSHTKKIGTMSFTKKLRRFLFGKAKVTSELRGLKLSEHALALQEDMDFSVVDREIVGISWDEFEKEETVDYCLDEIKASENLVKHTEKIDSVATQNDSISGLSHTKKIGTMSFTKKLRRFLFGKAKVTSELRGLKLSGGYFELRLIKAATRNFSSENLIVKGGFGSVYRGILPDGTAIAVKPLSTRSMQGIEEFANLINTVSALQHLNLVKLIGVCTEGGHLLLVYEYMENNFLAHALIGSVEVESKLNWGMRLNICLGIARGLTYLHEESELQMVHRDIKPTNILLDNVFNPKISDFGLARHYNTDDLHVSTRLVGTIGYMAPEYALRGYLMPKADVYSFGVVTLEIFSGKKNAAYTPNEDYVYLLDLAHTLHQEAQLIKLVDPALGHDYSQNEAVTILELAIICTNPSPTLRQTMSKVVKIIEGER